MLNKACISLVMLICASCASMRSDAEADGMSRREAALALLVQRKQIRERGHSESGGTDILDVTEALMDEFGSWGDEEIGHDPSPRDLTAILTLVKADADVGTRILSVTEYAGGRARVNTGEHRGPLNGFGRDFFLVKTGSLWSIIYRQSWLS
jgi:hypothetical protein